VQTPAATPFERFGGHEFFDLLVARFYAGVASDPTLRPMYPEDDLGHPRLRMRHAPYPVDAVAHDAWLRHMRAALDEAAPACGMSAEDEAELWDYLSRAAHSMVNTYPGPA
jgi:hemoglobin